MGKMLKAWLATGGVGLLLLAGCDGSTPAFWSDRPQGSSDQRAAQPLEKPQDSATRADISNLDRGAGAQIIAVGDSITAGAGVGPQATYPSLLSQSLNLPIVNSGRGGDTTATA